MRYYTLAKNQWIHSLHGLSTAIIKAPLTSYRWGHCADEIRKELSLLFGTLGAHHRENLADFKIEDQSQMETCKQGRFPFIFYIVGDSRCTMFDHNHNNG